MKNRLVWSILAVVLTFAGPTFAHHGTSEYDMSKTTTLKGTVTAFDFSNPHAMVTLEVKTDTSIEKWRAETNSPLLLARAGWTRNSLKPGDQITITGHTAKNSTNLIRVVNIVFANGQELNPGG